MKFFHFRAKKLIYDHRNPIVKVDVSGSKLFLKSSTQEEAEFIEKHQSNLENILNYERAERRCLYNAFRLVKPYNTKVTFLDVRDLMLHGHLTMNWPR